MALSHNRAPAPDLAPWIGRLVSAKVANGPARRVDCAMCNDTGYVRLIFAGRWTAHTADGPGTYGNEALLFGQHSRSVPISCTGHIMTAGFSLRAGAFHALTGRAADGLVDRIERSDPFGLTRPEWRGMFTPESDPESWNLALEAAIRRYIARYDPPPPDPVAVAFELAAFADPGLSLSGFAHGRGISLRQLERIVRRDFGITPRLVLRRARVLDLASQLCGVADDAESAEMTLRYFDQSHLIREFSRFFGTTPREFRSRPHPLLTIALEQRQARRLEELGRGDAVRAPSWRAG